MTKEEFIDMERRMAINRGEVEVTGFHVTTDGNTLPSIDPVEWPEHMIEAECTRLLEQDGWRALRTDPVSDRGRGKGFGEKGMADHLYIRYQPAPGDIWKGQDKPNDNPWMPVAPCQARVLWVEFKSAEGTPQSNQITWHTNERARGALTWIAGIDFPASVAGFVEHYRQSGLNRGRV